MDFELSVKSLLVREGYRNLSLPEQLYNELEGFLNDSNGRYVSVAEVVREAIRDFLNRKQVVLREA